MDNLRISNWNVQGRPYRGTLTSFTKIAPHLSRLNDDIICFQEMCEAKARLSQIDELKNYQHFIPQRNRKSDDNPGFNHNVILSKYPIVSSGEVNFESLNDNVRFENTSKVKIKLPDSTILIYNCHFAIDGVGINTRLKQLEIILKDVENHDGPAVICGDMNVTIPKNGLNRGIISLWHQEPKSEMYVNGKFIQGDERDAFVALAENYKFKEVFDLYTPTWSPFYTKKWEMFKLKLDWFMVKDASVKSALLGDYISDHRPMFVELLV